MKIVHNIIDDRIDLATTNVYIAQASDGDNWSEDDEVSEEIVNQLLQKVQYFAYVQTESAKRLEMKQRYEIKDLLTMYMRIAETNKNLQARHVTNESEVYPVLRSLFEGDKK